jgi:hypothetical protein
MNVKELKEILEQYPEDMQIWVSDRGYCEGGEKLVKVERTSAYSASLDGDEIDDEYFFVEEDTNISEFLSKGYSLSEDGEVLYKDILYLNDN